MSEVNGYRWEPTTAAGSDGRNGTDAESSYRWEKSEADRRMEEAEELRKKIAELDRKIRELSERKAENDFAASMMGEGDYSHYANLMNSRRQARQSEEAKAGNERAAWMAERENAQASLDEYLKQYRDTYANFRMLPTEEQERAKISGEFLRKKAETLAKKYGLDLPNMEGIANPSSDGVTLETLLYDIQRKADAGELTDADVKAFESALLGLKGDFSSYVEARKKVEGYETKEARAARKGRADAARKRETLRLSIAAKYKRAEIAGDEEGMDAAIVEWKKNGFKGEIG